jgi:hypothetical protein
MPVARDRHGDPPPAEAPPAINLKEPNNKLEMPVNTSLSLRVTEDTVLLDFEAPSLPREYRDSDFCDYGYTDMI